MDTIDKIATSTVFAGIAAAVGGLAGGIAGGFAEGIAGACLGAALVYALLWGLWISDAASTKRQERLDMQQSCGSKLTLLSNQALEAFEALPRNLLGAEEILDQAEIDLKDGAFSPFWDSVERATTHLASFDSGLRTITTNSKQHRDTASILISAGGTSPSRFPVVLNSTENVRLARASATRLMTLVRQAQRNFHFATIYEQRRTNQILVAGFTQLGEAIALLGERLEISITALSAQMSALTQNVDALHSTVTAQGSDQAQRFKHALEMLDNIQRRRIPYPRRLNDGAY